MPSTRAVEIAVVTVPLWRLDAKYFDIFVAGYNVSQFSTYPDSFVRETTLKKVHNLAKALLVYM